MRGMIAELASPHPLSDTLPSMLREDPFARSLCESFDDVLAPVLLTLDTFDNYLDPDTTPVDMIPWLAQWLGLGAELNADLARQRDELRIAGSLNVTRGTRRSIELVLEQALGMPVEVSESGGARWTPSPGGSLPGEPDASITVVVRPSGDVTVDIDRLDALVRSVKPAHVRHVVSVQPG
jgi:phage tail-like protein